MGLWGIWPSCRCPRLQQVHWTQWGQFQPKPLYDSVIPWAWFDQRWLRAEHCILPRLQKKPWSSLCYPHSWSQLLGASIYKVVAFSSCMDHTSKQDCDFPELGNRQTRISARRRKTPLSVQGSPFICYISAKNESWIFESQSLCDSQHSIILFSVCSPDNSIEAVPNKAQCVVFLY